MCTHYYQTREVHIGSHTQEHTITRRDSAFQINARGESMDGGGWEGKITHGKDIFRKVKDLQVG